jgi:hypothetical protein
MQQTEQLYTSQAKLEAITMKEPDHENYTNEFASILV